MCGIFGVTGSTASQYADKSKDVLPTLEKRGPDGVGILAFPGALLGHTRLSIIDVAGGAQPMQDSAQKVSVTFNGEIYNYRELRENLQKLGYRFTTQSDTEVVLKCYIEYGEGCVKHLDGMFAFAVWDEKRQCMFLARDRFGEKPLYYAFDTDENFLIASEPKALIAAGIKNDIDSGSLDAYLAFGYLPPWKSIYKNISLLPPAHCGVYANSTLKLKRYWHLEYQPLSISYTEAKEEAARLLQEAVRKRVSASDVEVGVFLSGGIDSTLITRLAQEALGRPVKTFSLGYGIHKNELPYAAEAASRIDTEHYEHTMPEDPLTNLINTFEYLDEPHADSSDPAQYLLSRFASTKVKVVLSGDGGDELFLGYDWYRGFDTLAQYVESRMIFSSQEREALLQHPATSPRTFYPEHVEIVQNIEKQINTFDFSLYLPGQILYKADRTGMAHSLEVRSPFLDTQLAEFAYNLPPSLHTSNGQGKHILKDLASDFMPEAFVKRKKRGFGAPLKEILNTPQIHAQVLHILGKNSRTQILFPQSSLETLMPRLYEKSAYRKIWVLLCLELWLAKRTPLT